uniref:Ion_trans domain-containing protein n=1 Tax=Heterorhabditis bacteriophora TaxID=37862 RepID=A0A1I7XFL8_HETBA
MTTEMNRRPSGRSNTANIESVIRRDTIQLSNRVRYMRRLRLNVYNFLDHPLSSRSAWYHFDIYFYMEVTLAVFFLSEFLIRMWAVSADAKYIGLKGNSLKGIPLVLTPSIFCAYLCWLTGQHNDIVVNMIILIATFSRIKMS